MRSRIPLALVFTLAAGCSEKTERVVVPVPTDARISVEDATGNDLDGGTLAAGSFTSGHVGAQTPFFVRNLGGSALAGPGGGAITISLSGPDAAQFSLDRRRRVARLLRPLRRFRARDPGHEFAELQFGPRVPALAPAACSPGEGSGPWRGSP
jgi:hypothetical protein